MAWIPRANATGWTQRTGYLPSAGPASLIHSSMPTVIRAEMIVTDGLSSELHATRNGSPTLTVGHIRKHNAEVVEQADYESDFQSEGVIGATWTITGPTDAYYWLADVFTMPDGGFSRFNWWEHYRYIEPSFVRLLVTDDRVQECTRTITDGGAAVASVLPKFGRYFKAPAVGERTGLLAWAAKVYSGNVFTFMGDDYRDDANRAAYNGNGPPYTLNSDYWVAWVEVTDGGSGYTSEPTVTAANDLGGSAPALRAVINDAGQVVAIWVKQGGQASEYASAPAITISGGGGTGATASAHLSSEIYCLAPATTPSHYAAFHGGTASIQPMTQPWGRDLILGGFDGRWRFGRDDGSTTWWVGEAFIWGTPNGNAQTEWQSGAAPSAQPNLYFYAAQVVNMQESDVFHENGGTYDLVDTVGPEHLVAGVGSAIGQILNIPVGSIGSLTMPSITAGTWVVPVIEVESGYPIDGAEFAIHLPFETPTPEWAIPCGRDRAVMPA